MTEADSPPIPADVLDSARAARRRALADLVNRQQPDGRWEAEMVANTMILSQYVIVSHVLNRAPDSATRQQIITHYRVTQTPSGGWGMHPESEPYVFFTTLAYVALRLLDVDPDDPLTDAARRWLHAQPGGVLAIPTWGKFWLAMLGLYDFGGLNPMPPELFLVPRWLPIHPDKLMCHTRAIYQAMAYLYGRRFTARPAIVEQLRQELYGTPVDRAAFAACRDRVAATDLHAPATRALRTLNRMLLGWERWHSRALRERALARCLHRIRAEQASTHNLALSPVNGLLNCLALYAHDPTDHGVDAALAGLQWWRKQDQEAGIRYVGARSQTWDTSFALHALLAGPEPVREAIRRGCAFLRTAQMRHELPVPAPGRDPILGSWGFADSDHLLPVSDCTAEALGVLLHDSLPDQAPVDMLIPAARFLLDRQNADGGFGAYERRRAPNWLQAANPSEMFIEPMVEGSYIDCTGSAMVGLARVRPYCDGALGNRVDEALRSSQSFLRRHQQPDGSFPASWGINFTYGTLFAVRGLRAAGAAPGDPALTRAAAWLTSVQRPDGGWGEHWSSCLRREYVEHRHSQPVMTSWAVLALLAAGGDPRAPAITDGVRWLCDHQRPDGSWPLGAVNGVHNRTSMLHYQLYPCYFPTWALGQYLRMAGDPPGEFR